LQFIYIIIYRNVLSFRTVKRYWYIFNKNLWKIINNIFCFSEVTLVSTASHSSSTFVAKMNLHRVLPWIWCFLITNECYNAKNRGEDGSKLIRIGGDIILGGIFPMHEQVSFFNFFTHINLILPASHRFF